MVSELSFSAEEEKEIAAILLEALRIAEPAAQESHVRERCGDNEKMLWRLLTDLSESRHGENASFCAVLQRGTEIGNYKIDEKIGDGGFSTVYRAIHKISQTFAAIKIFDKELRESNIDIVWNKEGKSLTKLHHENIIKFYDLGFYEQDHRRFPYVVVELLEGYKLDEYCAREDSILDVLALFRSLGAVVDYIHEKQILHLDLTPNNIIVTALPKPTLKLIDFGSSKLFRNEPRRLTKNDYFFPLTVKYASPEQCEHQPTDHRSDIYSLGVVLYQLLTGFVPFGEGVTDKKAISRDVTDRDLLPVLPSVRVLEIKADKKFGLPKANLSRLLRGDLDAIVMKCLKKRRRDRYQTVSALNRDIDNFLRGKSVKARTVIGYRQWRFLTRILGLKGGRVGWVKWRKPLERLLLFAVLLPLLFVGAKYAYTRLTEYPPIRKTLVRRDPIRLRVLDEQGKIVEREYPDYYYIDCQENELRTRACFTFLAVPATRPNEQFEMGRQEKEEFVSTRENQSPQNIQQQEDAARPLQKIQVKRFYMSRFEITNRQWNIVAKSKRIRIDLEVTNDNSSLPKTNVTYAEVREFCERLSRDLSESAGGPRIVRLPSEAEWEYACRAGTHNRYGGSDVFVGEFINAMPDKVDPSLDPAINKLTGPLSDSYFVGNSFGFAAMNGNVWEMTLDSWHKNYLYTDEHGVQHSAPTDGSAWEPLNMDADNNNKEYVLRGGAFNRPPYMTQCSYRTNGRFVSSGNDHTGFRIVLEVQGL